MEFKVDNRPALRVKVVSITYLFVRMTVLQDGKKVLEMKPIEIKFLDNIPDSVFVRP